MSQDPDKCDAADGGGGPCITLIDGKLIAGGTVDVGKDTCNPAPSVKQDGITGNSIPLVIEKSSDLWGMPDRGTPSCAGLPSISESDYEIEKGKGGAGDKITLSPGIYTKGIKITGSKTVVTMNPGMYCLDGDLSITAGSLNGQNVMFVMRPNSSINIQTDGPVSLSAPADDGVEPLTATECIPDDSIYTGYCWSGFLVYMPYENTGLIAFAGGNTSTYTGTIYAPGPPVPSSQPKCKITGNAENISINSSIICYTVQVGGTGNIDIKYLKDANAQSPAIVELSK
jgi:hypothetical protein